MSALTNHSASSAQLTPAERVLRPYADGLHPAARPLMDAIGTLTDYRPSDAGDLAHLLESLGGGNANCSVINELANLIDLLRRSTAAASLPEASQRALDETLTAYVADLQESGDEQIGRALDAIEGGIDSMGGAR